MILFLLGTIAWVTFGVVSMLYIIIDHLKTNGNFEDFKLNINEFIIMFLIIVCGPICGIYLMRRIGKT